MHGEWENWCQCKLGMTPRHVKRFIRIYDRFGNQTSMSGLGVAALEQLIDFTEEQRNQPHTIPSTGATKTVDEMTVRELREVFCK
ncbi:hypothetical protein JOC93_003226 [Priestia taiwanensis]|uniref:Uncharacterized protein n=1 Tax=Priestia taiwanensis TaxID=1347902 RepID=A0A917ERG6_9BACI|nr:hypothetical protein [Priestia taiwanensis]GGE80447.1 hypothetical protein GCM10007140_32460 [Priestia taiwanensis]